MADVVQTLLSFPPDKKELSPKELDSKAKTYLKEIAKFQPNAWTKKYDKQELLELLDPAVNSIAYLFALNRQIEVNLKDNKRLEQLFGLAQIFLASFDRIQVRYAAAQWRELLDFVIDAYANLSSPDLTPLVGALLRLDPSAGTFTSTHLKLVRLCLSTGRPSQALPILDRDIYAFPQKPVKDAPDDPLSEEHEMSNAYIIERSDKTEKAGFTLPLLSNYVLEYYLLGATIYIGLRNYSRARLFLEYVLLSPSSQHQASALQVEAYKKWILVGLLADGKAFPHPKTVDQIVFKNIRSCSKPYDALSESFEKRDYRKLQAEAQLAYPLWQDDGNVRLVHEVINALSRYRVIDLQKTYAALPLTRVASILQMQFGDALQTVQDTIRGGHLNASLSSAGADAVLRFHATASASNTSDFDLAVQTDRIQKLVNFIRDADRRLSLTKELVEHQKRIKRAGGPDSDLADVMDLSWDNNAPPVHLDEDGDEDIMGL